MAPFSAVILLIIDDVTSQHRSALPFDCALLTVATLWRWVWLAFVQRRVQEDLRGEPPAGLRNRLPAILLARLICCMAIGWGGLLIVPAFYGFLLAGFAAPALLEGNGATFEHLGDCLRLIHHASWRLVKLVTALGVGFILVSVGVLGMHLLVVNEMMGSLLDLNVADLSLTLGSRFWLLSVAYLMLVVCDFYWTVASVMVFYDLRSRRLGSDLRLQMRDNMRQRIAIGLIGLLRAAARRRAPGIRGAGGDAFPGAAAFRRRCAGAAPAPAGNPRSSPLHALETARGARESPKR